MRILIVDDEEDFTFALKNTITDMGYEVEAANSGEEALEKYKHFKPNIVITDQDMPGITGVELSEKLRDIRADVKIILYTGKDDIETKDRRYFYRIFKKPIPDDELDNAIQEIERRM